MIDPTAAPGQRATEGVRVDRRPDGTLVVDLRDHQGHLDGPTGPQQPRDQLQPRRQDHHVIDLRRTEASTPAEATDSD